MSHSVDEVYSFYAETVHCARKAHVCDACKRPIRAGDSYCAARWVFDGTLGSVKRCGACQATHEHLRKLGGRVGMWPNERLACGLDYEEEWGELPDEVARLAFLTDDERGRLLAKRTQEPWL